MAKHVQAGIARVDISPPAGITQGIWAAQTHQRAIGLDMPLYATSLVLDDGHTSIAIVDVDLLGFDEALAAEIRSEIETQTGIPVEAVRLSASHSHSGPNYFRKPLFNQGVDLLESYMEALPKRIASSVWEAQSRVEPIQIGYGTGQCRIATNRRAKLPNGRVVVGRNPAGPVDHTVRILRLASPEGETVATIFHYACHPTVLAWDNRHIAPDFPGPARLALEKAVGGLALFLQGAAGNIGPIEGYTGDLSVYRRLGKALGLEAASIALQIQVPPRKERFVDIMESGAAIAVYHDEPSFQDLALRVENRLVRLPLRKDFPDLAVAEQKESLSFKQLEEARRKDEPELLRECLAQATRAWAQAEAARHYKDKDYLEWPLQAIQIGPCVLMGFPGEPFIEIAEKVCAKSQFPMTLFSGYTNGGFGYIPTAAAFAEGGYEIDASPFSAEAADILVSESIGLLESMQVRSSVA